MMKKYDFSHLGFYQNKKDRKTCQSERVTSSYQQKDEKREGK